MEQTTTYDLQQRIEAGKQPHILDVRETDEFEAGHIPGALNIPLSILPVRYHELDKATNWDIICLGGARSARACEFLEGLGYNVTNVQNGMSAWAGAITR